MQKSQAPRHLTGLYSKHSTYSQYYIDKFLLTHRGMGFTSSAVDISHSCSRMPQFNHLPLLKTNYIITVSVY